MLSLSVETLLQILRWPGVVEPSYELLTPLVAILDLLAVSVCAVTGVLVARSKQMDLVGLTVIAVVSSIGGGTIRDTLLGKLPVFWVSQPLSLVAALLAGWMAFMVSKRVPMSPRWFVYPDALGLALFTIVGAEKSLTAGHGWLVSALMGVITGVFGGVLRDIICREIPSVFKQTELYATASLVGALAFIAARGAGVPAIWAVASGTAFVVVLRLVAVRWNVRLPGLQ